MPPDQHVGTPEDWLRHARSDLAVAKQKPSGDILPATLAFHAQQAAEKSLKAVLLAVRIEFPFKHDIAFLITLVEKSSFTYPVELRNAAALSAYAAMTRYPGSVDVTAEDCARACSIAEKVYKWAADLVGTGSG